jgi:hypothetical protein
MQTKVWNVKIYTRTTHKRIGGKYHPEMIGVIEAPINKMMKAYPDEFSFMRHQTRREARPSKKGKS